MVFKENRELYKLVKSLSPEERAENCQKCGECETKCPQGLHIRDLLDMVAQALS
jgi:predicted aldo/keto reductase-like oxidoreductase